MLRFLLLTLMSIAIGACSLGLYGISTSITPDPKVASPGQTFTVNLRLDSNTPVRGVTLWLSHDTSRLRFVSAAQGSLFNGANVGWWIVNTTDLPGTTRVECIIFGLGQYITGPGNLLDITFTAIAGDFCTLHVAGIELYHHQTGLILPDVSTSDASVIIGFQTAYARAKCWLQGPYNSGRMTISLGTGIPLDSPYTSAAQSISAIPEGVVDWVLVQLRGTPTGNVLYSQSAFIFGDGSLRSPGKPFLIFMETPPGNYYLVVRHRNHLAAMSASAVTFVGNGSPILTDLSDLNSVYGRAGITEVESGVYALAAGDADQDGGIFPSDRNLHWRLQSGMNGYLSGDFNLDGNVFPSDLNNLWRNNSGMGSQVPGSSTNSQDHWQSRGGIQYTIANAQVVAIGNERYLDYDVMARASITGQRLGTGILLINYNPAVFGNNVSTAGNISVSRSSLLLTEPFSLYGLIVNDNTSGRVAITFEYMFISGWGNTLSIDPMPLVHVRMKVLASGGGTGISFSQDLMANQQYLDDNVTLFYPVLAQDAQNIYLPLAPQEITLSIHNGILSLTWQAQPNCEYTVYSTSSLESNVWIVEASGLLQPGWQSAMTSPSRFYRVIATGIAERNLGE